MERGYLVYGLVFTILFISHILAAANDYDILFRIIASLISLQVIFTGLIFHKLSIDVTQARIPVLLLSAGLGYAYLGMNIKIQIIIYIILGIIVQYGTEKALKYGEQSGITNG